MTTHKGQVGQPGNAGEFAKKVGTEAARSANLSTRNSLIAVQGGTWIAGDGDGKLYVQGGTRAYVEAFVDDNPDLPIHVGLYIPGETFDARGAQRMARISGDIAEACKDIPEATRVEFDLSFNDEFNRFEVNDLTLYDAVGADVSPDDDNYYDTIDGIENNVSVDDMALLANTTDRACLKIR